MKKFYKAYRQVLAEAYYTSEINVINESYEMYQKHLITEGEMIEKIKGFFKGIGDIFSGGWEWVTKKWESIKSITSISSLLNVVGLTDKSLEKLSKMFAGCLILVPVGKVGFDMYSLTKVEIQNEDFAVLLNREKFNDQTLKFFREKSLISKIFTLGKKLLKNLFVAIAKNIPMILSCFVGAGLSLALSYFISGLKNAAEKIAKEVKEQKNLATGQAGDAKYVNSPKNDPPTASEMENPQGLFDYANPNEFMQEWLALKKNIQIHQGKIEKIKKALIKNPNQAIDNEKVVELQELNRKVEKLKDLKNRARDFAFERFNVYRNEQELRDDLDKNIPNIMKDRISRGVNPQQGIFDNISRGYAAGSALRYNSDADDFYQLGGASHGQSNTERVKMAQDPSYIPGWSD